jgi:ferredoxin-NADP reductase
MKKEKVMEQHIVKILSIQHITHDVLQIVTEKPERYFFTPGQATEIAIKKVGWEEERRPFTFTSLPKYQSAITIEKKG